MDTTLPSANPEEMTETIGRLFNQPHFWSRLLYAVLLLLCCMVVMRVLNALVNPDDSAAQSGEEPAHPHPRHGEDSPVVCHDCGGPQLPGHRPPPP